MKKKVLYISYNGMTDPLGQAQVMPYLFELVKEGYDITILSCEKKERLERDGKKIKNAMEKAGLKWHTIIFHDSIPLASKIYDRFTLKKKAFKLFRKEKYDLIHCRSYVASEIGLALKEKFSVKFIFDMRGFWADEKKDNLHWNVEKPLYKYVYKYYKKVEEKLLLQADSIVVLTHSAKDEIEKWSIGFGIKDKILIIPCCADLSHFSEQNIDSELQEKLKKELDITNHFPVFCYLGSIGEAYAINEMLIFFNLLKKKYHSAKFLFFTKDSSSLVTNKLKLFPHLKISDIAVRFVQRNELPTYLSLCNFSVFFYVPTYSRIACSPTKFAEISGMGLPVVCNTVGDLNEKYLHGLPHIVLNDLNSKTIEKSIEGIKDLETANKNKIRSFALESYNLKNGVDIYLGIYRSLID